LVHAPNVYVVGAPKCGTWSLFEHFRLHPDVFVPDKKELHYYSHADLLTKTGGPGDAEILRPVVKSKPDYLAYYAGATKYPRAADVSPSYLYNLAAGRRIAADVPDARIVAILRDPVERAYSQYLHMRRAQHEALSFNEALDAEQDRIAAGWADGWRYVAGSRYSAGVAEYLDLFGRDRVHVLFTEELADRPADVLRALFGFLDVTTEVEVADIRRNVGGEARSARLARTIARPSRLARCAAALLPQSTRTRISLRLFESNVRAAPPMLDQTRERLRAAFTADVTELSRLLGRDLPWPAAGPRGTGRR
jgi:hypothetical protein